MKSPKQILKLFKEHEDWAKNIQLKCNQMEQRYVGIPIPLSTCKLTNEPCDFESCPKRVKKE